jgi:D-alanyl-D-alanine carboxypeptidase
MRRFLPLLYVLILTGVSFFFTGCNQNQDENFQAALDDLHTKYGFPGATAAYVLPDGSQGAAAAGLADIEAGKPMTVRSRMLAASIGKTFVGATTIALEHEGLLDLHTPISHWLGSREWFSRLPNHNAITLYHLLTHSSGLPDHVFTEKFASELSQKWKMEQNPFSHEKLISYILDTPPLFKPGEGWSYTDTGYILIGLIIEEAAGQSYYQQIEERFIIPLDLTMTEPSNKRILPGLASGYTDKNNPLGFPSKSTAADGRLAWHPGIEWTGGGLVSNSGDLARWGAALFSGKAMRGDYLNSLLDSVPVNPETSDHRYGAGVSINRAGRFGQVYGHGGWIPGYSSSLRYYADYGVAVAIQINTDSGITDGETPVMREMEDGLAEVVISGILIQAEEAAGHTE